ncbi:MAG: DUF1073 domain-containing protein [Bradyrhizobium sp.]|nr:DUF1073 domain-containing protein [Bradyrhizobium sp.]
MFDWFRSRQAQAPTPQPRERASFWTTHADDRMPSPWRGVMRARTAALPRPVIDGAQDSISSIYGSSDAGNWGGAIPDALALWYVNQGFIGHQLAALAAQHWLVDKACTMPGRDAIRNGFNTVSVDGDELPDLAIKMIGRLDRSMRLRWNLEQFVRMGRVFGIRIALFKVDSTDPGYYEKPFNLDGVQPGSYKGIVQVDPYWTAPLLDQNAASQPDTKHFYEPTWWQIQGRKYHRSHLIIYRHSEPPDILKPAYLYGGVPVPQQIMERVYAAERTANEAPQLAQTKRTTVWRTDMARFVANANAAEQRLQDWITYRDNYSVKLGDLEGDDFQQFETSLADLDSVIMTQYQLVAAASGVPATKLLGTTPKGFNATGEYEEASYHEMLESIQAHDLTPLIERHHALCMRSFIRPKLGIDVETTVQWEPLDSATAQEQAAINLTKAQTGAALIASGAIDGSDERTRIATDPASGYHGLGAMPPEDLQRNDEDDHSDTGQSPGDKDNAG